MNSPFPADGLLRSRFRYLPRRRPNPKAAGFQARLRACWTGSEMGVPEPARLNPEPKALPGTTPLLRRSSGAPSRFRRGLDVIQGTPGRAQPGEQSGHGGERTRRAAYAVACLRRRAGRRRGGGTARRRHRCRPSQDPNGPQPRGMTPADDAGRCTAALASAGELHITPALTGPARSGVRRFTWPVGGQRLPYAADLPS
jgi:hypothetical protein